MKARDFLENIFWPIKDVIAPTLRSAEDLYVNVLKSYVKQGIIWLDIGSGHQILAPWRYEDEKSLVAISQLVVGIDHSMDSLRSHRSVVLKVKGDITNLPFRDNCFDLVTANMVVEHLDDPEIQFKQVSKIMRPGGIFIIHTPNTLSIWVIIARLLPDIIKSNLIKLLEGRKENDTFTAYYKANSRKKIVEMASKSGFKVDRIRMLVSLPIFGIIPPIVILELIWIRILMIKCFKQFRPNIIAILKRKGLQKEES